VLIVAPCKAAPGTNRPKAIDPEFLAVAKLLMPGYPPLASSVRAYEAAPSPATHDALGSALTAYLATAKGRAALTQLQAQNASLRGYVASLSVGG